MQTDPLVAYQASPNIDLNDSHITLLTAPAEMCRVLLVDDDELVVKRLSIVLDRGGYEVRTARSGQEALSLLSETPCEIVLTDWHMPDMDGLELCRNLRQTTINGYTYILMLSVRDGENDILAGLSAGADDYVIKGATSEEILARVGVGRRITHLERSLRRSNDVNRHMSVTDPLTGAHNRRFLMKFLPRELERSRNKRVSLAILSCDIDRFKRINDNFGHAAGDDILRAFVSRATGCLREGLDWIARTGGEEFVIVLPDTDVEAACRVAKKLRSDLAAQPMASSAGPLTVTVSMGITAVDATRDICVVSATELLRAGDRGMYASKRLGRNRATVTSVVYGPMLTDEQVAVVLGAI